MLLQYIQFLPITVERTMTVTLFAAVVVSMLASSVYGYAHFQHEIPNGDRVPNTCFPSTKWMGVGHQNVNGGGERNPFGNDFKANGKTWNKTICQKDSDGDGLSNGQELGDPNCVWTIGQTPTRSENITHPGVCEPLGSTKCTHKNFWLTKCNDTKFECPGINDSGVKNYTMRFPQTSVRARETTYICYLFRLPNDSDADIIAIEPVIDNMEIVHHMILFGCGSDVSRIDSSQPFFCAMGGGVQCSSMIGLWSFGSLGQCLNSRLGFRIGPTGYQHAVVQIHWNNPKNKPNLTDSSGMRIYYTENLRPNRGDIMMVGQHSLTIPPGQDNVTFSGSCTALCTKAKMNQSVYITSSALHMHLLGKAGIIRLYRNGQLLQVIEEVANYDYNKPIMMEFETPIEVKPGDSIQVKCVYNSIGKTETTVWGHGTSNEMCYGFFAYYPYVEEFTFCGQLNSIAFCDAWKTIKSDRCDLTTFRNYLYLLPTLCSANCSDSKCTEAVNAALKTGCHRDEDIWEFMSRTRALNTLAYCSLALQQPADTVCIPVEANQTSNHCSPINSYSGSIPLLAFMVYFRRLI